MRWQGREESSNIEDRRGEGGGGGLGGGGLGGGLNNGGFRIPIGGSRGGIGSLAVIIIFVIIAMAMGINPLDLLTGTVQAYIFATLAMVFIGGTLAETSHQPQERSPS